MQYASSQSSQSHRAAWRRHSTHVSTRGVHLRRGRQQARDRHAVPVSTFCELDTLLMSHSTITNSFLFIQEVPQISSKTFVFFERRFFVAVIPTVVPSGEEKTTVHSRLAFPARAWRQIYASEPSANTPETTRLIYSGTSKRQSSSAWYGPRAQLNRCVFIQGRFTQGFTTSRHLCSCTQNVAAGCPSPLAARNEFMSMCDEDLHLDTRGQARSPAKTLVCYTCDSTLPICFPRQRRRYSPRPDKHTRCMRNDTWQRVYS